MTKNKSPKNKQAKNNPNPPNFWLYIGVSIGVFALLIAVGQWLFPNPLGF